MKRNNRGCKYASAIQSTIFEFLTYLQPIQKLTLNKRPFVKKKMNIFFSLHPSWYLSLNLQPNKNKTKSAEDKHFHQYRDVTHKLHKHGTTTGKVYKQLKDSSNSLPGFMKMLHFSLQPWFNLVRDMIDLAMPRSKDSILCSFLTYQALDV